MKNENIMKFNKVELLAPAGNYESFLGAVNAGADAVYLAGEKFGARAYAANFSADELCRAIRYAHLWDKKVYLTLNTLVKEKEFDEIYEYLKPFYEEGLDGVIVQDMGVLSYVHAVFPELPIHISTQAMVTGANGAAFLKEIGAVRVVPARELSLEEIKHIKIKTGLEMETFIHGAMCYCYSGQCLFSSIAGGRSGNRGRCAQPCRLPYKLQINGESIFTRDAYPLSLKDMCTIENIPELIRGGIDSFKIEGRMKKPEYAAGVTALYRKYIDKYYDNPENFYKVSPKDMQILSTLYIRSEVENGYYFRHNGAEMITLDSPAYSGSDENLLEAIRQKYLGYEKKAEVSVSLYCHINEPLVLTMYLKDNPGDCVCVEGGIVEAASSRPVDEQTLQEKVCKLGNTLFEVSDCQIDLLGACFVPMKVLNDLRREVSKQLEDAILKQNRAKVDKSEIKQPLQCKRNECTAGFSVLVSNMGQFKAAINHISGIERLYIESELILGKNKNVISEMLWAVLKEETTTDVYIALPFIFRKRDEAYIEELKKFITDNHIKGCLIRNPEELGIFVNGDFEMPQIELAQDAGMYNFQSCAVDFFSRFSESITLPYELNRAEKKNLLQRCKGIQFEQIIYGRIPMMITANCLAKTAGKCNGEQRDIILTDRYNHDFVVQNVCEHCYNIIWNCIPLSLHSKTDDYNNCIKRIQFSVEQELEAESILNYFVNNAGEFPVKEYTTGHEKRGVE